MAEPKERKRITTPKPKPKQTGNWVGKKTLPYPTGIPGGVGVPNVASQYTANTREVKGGTAVPKAEPFAAASTAADASGNSAYSNPVSNEGRVRSRANANEPPSESLYGFAGRNFSSADLPTVWENPWLIVNAALKERGNDTIPLKEMMRQYGEYGLPIFTMLKGLTGDTGDLGSADTINWISRWINSMSSLGGNVPSYEGLLGQLLQGRGTDTILGEALNSGQSTDQVNTLMTYLRAALGTNSLNPIASSAVLSQANREGDEFLEASMGGQDGYTRNFTDWINSGGHRLFGDERL